MKRYGNFLGKIVGERHETFRLNQDKKYRVMNASGTVAAAVYC